VYRQVPPFGRFEWFDDTSTVATWLHDAGYTTGLFGKYLNGYQHAAVTGYVPPGWDRWVAFVRPGALDYTLTVDGELQRPPGHSTEVLAEQAVRFVEEAEGPLFLVYSTASPHTPATPLVAHVNEFRDLSNARPPSFDEADVSDKPAWVRDLAPLTPAQQSGIDELRRREFRSLLGVDEAVGAILDALEAEGRLSNTLLIYTSDNGLLHGEHRWTKKEAPYEEAIRVPLVLRWDAAGWVPGTERDGVLALNIDLASTIAEAAGVAHPSTDGASLLPVAADPGAPWRTDFLLEHLEGSNPIPTYCGVRSVGWKYVAYSTGEQELYDLDADPYELRNLATDPSSREVLERLRVRLRELCDPPPPGYRDRSAVTVPLALGLLALIVAIEVVAVRRRAGPLGDGR
jgi:arylsulfatase A-like enzyme